MSDTCSCGRQKYTTEDLARWQSEIDAFGRNGGDARDFNPEWARSICWTMRAFRCQMRPL